MPNASAPPPSHGELVARLRHLAETDPALAVHVVTYAPGEILLCEGSPNDRLFVLLHGEVSLLKTAEDGTEPVAVSEQGPGDLLGVNSIATRSPSFSTVRARTPLRCLRLDASTLAALPGTHPEFHRLLERLITANLADRYRGSVLLQLRLARANQEITRTRNQLVHQEKMAVLGQLVAGLAHELNNPAAALLRQCEHLADTLAGLLPTEADAAERILWSAGREAVPTGSRAAREQAARLEADHPRLPRALLRRLAAVPAEYWPLLLPASGASALGADASRRLAFFEAALLLHAQRAATAQISHLVTGLKNYARPADGAPTPVNLRENIDQVLVILGHILRDTPLETDLDPTLEVLGRPGDLSQIWTNLIRNAREASGPGAPLRVTAKPGAQGEAVVEVVDHGPGVPPDLRARIFDLNYTSKTGRENFGLGLGLSICQSLVAAHHGRIEIVDTPGGGATFVVRLPLRPDA